MLRTTLTAYDAAEVSEGSKAPPIRRGAELPQAKLTPEIVRSMRQARRDGKTYRHIAESCGVNVATAHAAINGKNWSYVEQV